METININQLEIGLPGITKKGGGYFFEATVYCLELAGHQSGVSFFVETDKITKYQLIWEGDLEEEVATTWNDKQVLTEHGAMGLALLLVLELTDYSFFKRSRKGTGGDFLLGKKIKNNLPILDGILEISGIDKETPTNKIEYRVNEKIKRFKKLKVMNPYSYIIVIEFNTPKAKMVIL